MIINLILDDTGAIIIIIIIVCFSNFGCIFFVCVLTTENHSLMSITLKPSEFQFIKYENLYLLMDVHAKGFYFHR